MGSWVECYEPRDAAPLRLFCFPPVGAGASMFRSLSLNGSGVEVAAIQPPGRETRLWESPIDRVPALVKELAQELPRDKPFAFFGHSLGAIVAFELARELRRRGKEGPLHLFAAACGAPARIPVPDPPRHLWPDERLLAEIGRFGGTPPEVLAEPELVRLILPVLRADFALVETYKYEREEPLRCGISAYGGAEDRDVSQDDLSWWRAETRAPFQLRIFPGGHFFVQSARQAVAREVEATLAASVVS